MDLILASSSAIRRSMLDGAGIAYRSVRPDVDEGEVKSRITDPVALARELAAAKAESVAGSGAGDNWIVGSDSVISVDGQLFSKPRDRDEAAEHLRFFSGRTMELTSAVALARRGKVEWIHSDTAELSVRKLSDGFIEDYLRAEWPEVAYCVGVFRMEARGVQLFESIRGDYFTILGMPLVPLLGALRSRGVIAS